MIVEWEKEAEWKWLGPGLPEDIRKGIAHSIVYSGKKFKLGFYMIRMIYSA